MQDALLRELLPLWVTRRANSLGRRLEIVRRVTQLDVAVDQKPVRPRRPLKGHADAARVHDARFANAPLELHVGMAADDNVRLCRCENRQEALFGGRAGEDLSVVAWRSMAEESDSGWRVQSKGRWPKVHHARALVVDLIRAPLHLREDAVGKAARLCTGAHGEYFAVAVA